MGSFGRLNVAMPSWAKQLSNEDCLITVWVVPGASRSEVVGPYGDALKIKVTAPPEAGKANRALLKLLTKRTGAKATLEAGTTGRRKVVRMHRCGLEQALRTLTPGTGPQAAS